MKRTLVSMAVIVLAFGFAGPAWSDGDFVVYPAKGQSQDQTEKDKYECYNWAKQETGFDPMKTPTATAPPPPKEKETWGAGKGAVGGGLLGAGAGALIGGSGKGALIGGAVGAGSGAAVGGARRSSQKKRDQQRQQQWEQEQASHYRAGRNAYNRAYAACLEGRGYSVK